MKLVLMELSIKWSSDFSPVAKAQLEIDYMLGGKGLKEILLEIIILSKQMKG